MYMNLSIAVQEILPIFAPTIKYRNMKRLLLMLMMGLGFSAPKAQETSLTFDEKGEFKIVQFTDVHFKYGNQASDIALERIDEVLSAESPDLVVLTGDVIFSPPADKGLRTVLERVSAHNVPFVMTFGNHDDEQGMSRSQLYDIARSVKGNIQPDRGDRQSPDYMLTVKSSDGKGKDAAALYFFDSRSYSPRKDVEGYAWMTFEQVADYRGCSAKLTEANGGTPLPSLAFFHIPLPEYNQAAADEGAILIGTRMEKACAPALNTGMFTAMKEAGDVMGMFVGHDHDNDYTVMWHGILLGYGRYTGGNTVYNHLPNGARVIVLKEGQRTFDTWIDLKGGERKDYTVYPDSYLKK